MKRTGADTDGHWTEGIPLDDPALADAVLRLRNEAAGIAGEPDDEAVPPREVTSATALLDEASEWVLAALEAGTGAATARMLVAISDLKGDVREFGTLARGHALARVQAALARLRGVGSVEQLVRLAPPELCWCGFDRVMITRIHDARAIPQVIHVAADPECARDVEELAGALTITLDQGVAESDMLRRPGPLLVAEAQFDPRVVPAMLQRTGTRSYVAAPIMPEGQVIGFLHADCHTTRRMLDVSDRDLLWTFAQGFGYAWERAVLLERLRTLRQDVRRGHSSVLAVMDEFCEAHVEIAQFSPDDRAVMSSAAAVFVSADTRPDTLLTRRELEVMELMAVGETNSRIAEALFVSEGTVKSHVKHILRKLRAKNRAEAVSRFITLTRRQASV